MIKETLHTYRQERKAFIASLKFCYGIDFYKLDVQERNGWLGTYLEYKREFMEALLLAKNEADCLKEKPKKQTAKKQEKYHGIF